MTRGSPAVNVTSVRGRGPESPARWPRPGGSSGSGGGRLVLAGRRARAAAGGDREQSQLARPQECPRNDAGHRRSPGGERCTVRVCGASGAIGALLACLRAARFARAGLERARGARAGAPSGGPAAGGAGRLGAHELSDPGPRIRFFPGAGRRGIDRAAPAGQGGRARRGSVLAGPRPQQAGHPRLARRRLPSDRHQLPPRPPRHRHQQLRQPHPDRRGRRGARRAPSALAGRPGAYDYALGDSLTIRTGGGEVTVREVQVRPRSFARPLVVGTLYLDVETAELVRFRFSFTPSAYLDRQLEDISIVLENALLRGALLATVPAGDRDPASGQLARLSGARHHPRAAGRSRTTT